MSKPSTNKRANGEGAITYVESRKEWRGSIRDGVKPDGSPNRIYFSSGKGGTRADVVQKMQEWRIAKQQGLITDREVCLEPYILNWLETIKKPNLKPLSYDRLESIIKNQVLPRIGNYTVNSLTDSIIKEELLGAMEEDSLSVSSRKKAYDAIRSFLDYAVYKGYVLKNPMGMMKPPKNNEQVDAKDAPIADEGSVNFLNDDEIRTLYAMSTATWNTGKLRYPMGNAFIFILNTGLRMGEALALRWTDIDSNMQSVAVTKNLVVSANRDKNATTKQKLVVQNTPKSKKSRRVVPLNNDAKSALTRLKECAAYSNEGYIIRTQEGNPMLPRSFQQTLDLLCKAGGIKKIGLHTLRHTYATKLFEAGVDVKIISELLGHSSTEITYRIYIHVIEALKREAVTKAFDIMPK